jgi:TldD protein
VKDGVMIDGRGSYSIDQQRYNGQFGGHVFWEIKNGKITRMVTDVTYNAITTDFWANLDGVTGPDEWEMHGTGGDAKGQPTQSNSRVARLALAAGAQHHGRRRVRLT